jgi:ferredoxin
MKVKVDFELCESNALCMRAAPEIFQVDDQDFLNILIEGDIPADLQAKAREAARVCPRAAITIEE